MTKMRVYELAKEYNIPSKDFVAMLKAVGIEVTSNLSVVEGDTLKQIRNQFKNEAKNTDQKPNAKKPRPKKQTGKKKNELETDGQESQEDKPAGKKSVGSGGRRRPSSEQQANEDQGQTEQAGGRTQSRGNKRTNQQKPRKRNTNQQQPKDRSNRYSNEKPKRNAPPKRDAKKDKKSEGPIEISSVMTVHEFSEAIGETISTVITKLIGLGIMASQNQDIDFDTMELIASEFGLEVTVDTSDDPLTEEDIFGALMYEDDEKNLKVRPPVVTVMGHVDHGKTSLLDSIRSSRVQTTEAGGITQHIGASVATINNQKIVFLDTPGHEAFTQMRLRGAQTTDIVILVVAADDGVMPQTVEAINHAKAAEVPIIVAINKMDKDTANPDRVKQELMEYELIPEEWGGDTIMMPVSALKGTGIDDLLEMVLMVAEMQELKANPKRPAIGTVVEAYLDKGRGPVATVLIQNGTLYAGDDVVSGSASGRVRAMFDDKGKRVKRATPSMPVLIQGLSEVPEAGDHLFAVEDERTARDLAQKVAEEKRAEAMRPSTHVSLDDLFSKIGSGEIQDLNIIVKTDVKGTVDAVKTSLEKLSNEEVKVNIIHGAVGGITESDVMLASASNAVIIGFNVRPNQGAMDAADHAEVEIRTYRVIYDAIEDVKQAIAGMLAPTYKEKIMGRAQVRDTFRVPNAGTVAGVYVTNGKVTRNAKVRLLRNNVVIYEGEVSSMRRFKDDVRELNYGYEGGIGLKNYNDIKEGDEIEAYEMVEIKPEV